MRRPLVLVLALAAAACVFALVYVERERTAAPRGAPTSATDEPAGAPDPTAYAVVTDEGATVDTPQDSRSDSGAHSGAHEASADDATAPRRQRGRLVCDGPTIVVREFKAGDAPVSGAEVRWLALPRAFAERDRGWFADPDAGERYVADNDGRVRVPNAENGARVHVISGALVGDAEISPRAQGDVTVIVAPVEMFHVRVVDASGAPARGVRVILRGYDGLHNRVYAENNTTSDGRTALPFDPELRLLGGELSVETELLLSERVFVPVERANPPGEPIVIRLPPLGSLFVAIFGAHGVDADVDGKLSLWVEQPGSHLPAPTQWLTVREGVARAASIGLGTQLGAMLTLDTLPWAVELSGAGPVRAGEEALLALHVEELTWIRFRMLDLDGAPIRGSSVGVQVVSGTAQHSARFPSDAGGAVRVPLTDVWKLGDARNLRIDVASIGQALIDLARELPPGTTDLGDVHIGDGPRIAAGRVVDERGEPLSNARVQLVRFDNETQSERLPSAGLPRIATGLDGTFELIGLTDPDVYGLRVSASGYVTMRRPLVVGETGIVFTLAEYGSIRGNLVFTGEFTPENVEVWLADGNGAARKIAIESKGFFRAVDVAPGRWELLVKRAKSEDVLARVGGIELAPGGRVELEPIEVREPSEVRR